MNKTLFLEINSFAGHSHILDLFFIGCAEFMPYIFILAEVYLYFFANRKNVITGAIGAFVILFFKSKLQKANDLIINIEDKILKTKR